MTSASSAPARDPSPARPNVLFVAVDDLRNDLGVFGVSHAKTPRLDAFAAGARPFLHHYVQVPTCGASRHSLLRGVRPSQPAHLSNEVIRETGKNWAAASLPGIFRSAGYRTLALGKIGHYPGGLTGKDGLSGPEELPGVWQRHWIPAGPWTSPKAIMHGYANGRARIPGQSPPLEIFDGPDSAYPDAWVAQEAVQTLAGLAESPQPWFFAVGFFKPHLPFAAPKRWHDLHAAGIPDLPAAQAARIPPPSSWHNSGELRGNYGHEAGRDPATDPDYARALRRAYAASVSYADAQIGRLLEALDASPAAKNTIVVVWSDHGFLLGEHAIWGKHCLYEEALRSPLLIRFPGLPKPGEISRATVETVDLLPTLADLCGIPTPEHLDGRSLRPQLLDPAAASTKPAISHWTGGQRSIRDDRWRLITGKAAGHVELFDYQTDPGETRNLAAEHPQEVRRLRGLLPE